MAQLFDLNGKTALIVGASSGLGKRAAYALAEAGVNIIIASRNISHLSNLQKEMQLQATDIIAIQMDVSDKNSVRAAFQQIEQLNEKIDICINTAGIGKLTPIFETDEDNIFETIVQTNLIGTWYVTKEIANHMKKNEIHGSIITVSSINGANKLAESLAGYCASKAAVMQMTKALVGELAKFNIRINCIVPGLFHTEATHDRLSTDEGRKQIEQMIPLSFVAKPTDLDGLILYLASNAASRYVTGSCITIDGGLSWGG